MAFTTSKTVLSQISKGCEVSWEQFEKTYRPLVMLRGRDRGLFKHEYNDLLQQVLLSLFQQESVMKYDSTKGRFRDYLKKIIDRQAFKIIKKRQKKNDFLRSVEEHGVILNSENYDNAEKRWQLEWHSLLLDQAIEEVRAVVSETTYDAFIMTTIDEIDAETVAESLGVSVETVYVAKHRVLKRLRPIINKLEGEVL